MKEAQLELMVLRQIVNLTFAALDADAELDAGFRRYPASYPGPCDNPIIITSWLDFADKKKSKYFTAKGVIPLEHIRPMIRSIIAQLKYHQLGQIESLDKLRKPS